MNRGTSARLCIAALVAPFAWLLAPLTADAVVVTTPTVTTPTPSQTFEKGEPITFEGGGAEDLSEIQVYEQDRPEIGCSDVEADPTGHWSCTISDTRTLSPGHHTFIVVQGNYQTALAPPSYPNESSEVPVDIIVNGSAPALAVTATNSPLEPEDPMTISGLRADPHGIRVSDAQGPEGTFSWENECSTGIDSWECSFDPPTDFTPGDYTITIQEIGQTSGTPAVEYVVDETSVVMHVNGAPQANPPEDPPADPPAGPGNSTNPGHIGSSTPPASALPPTPVALDLSAAPTLTERLESTPVQPDSAATSPDSAVEVAKVSDQVPTMDHDEVMRVLGLGVAAMTILAMIGPHGLARASESTRRFRLDGAGGDHVATSLATTTAATASAAAAAFGSRSLTGGREESKARSDEFSRLGISRGDRSPTWRFPGWKWLDRQSLRFPPWLALRSPLTARVIADGSYLRAIFGVLWGLLPLAGIGLGITAAQQTTGLPVPPPIGIVSAILVIALLDSAAGGAAVLAFGLLVLARGGFAGSETLAAPQGLRGIIGLAALWFAVPLIAAAARPFLRMAAKDTSYVWDRLADTIIAALISGWVVEKIIDGLPGLIGHTLAVSHYAGRLALLTMAVIACRFVVQEIAATFYPRRLAAVQKPHELPTPGTVQQTFAVGVRTILFGFVAFAFIGNCWQLWVGLILFAIPQLLSVHEDRLPNVPALHRALPRGIVKILVMLVVGTLFARFVVSVLDDSHRMLRDGFVLLTIPGLALDLLGLIGRKSPRLPWTWSKQLLGAAIVVITVALVLSAW